MHRSSFSRSVGRSPLAAGAALLSALALTGLARPARADVSAWASVTSGPTWLDEGTEQSWVESKGFEFVPALSMQTGMGSSPANSFIGGGLLHMQTNFGRGTDLGVLGRVATQGFVIGRWGAALDLGGYARFWGVHSQGALGVLSLGAPWGITLAATGGFGTNEARQFGVLLGVDFARMTVFRQSGEDWFPNPFPAYRAAR